MFKKIFLFLLVALVLFIIYLVVNTLTFESKQLSPGSGTAMEPVEVSPQAKENFANAIRIKTISPENPADFDSVQFRAFRAFLEVTYPLTDSILEKRIFNEFSYLYEWKGTDPSLKPIVLMGHTDVVPVIEESIVEWHHDPFGGEIVNDTIWGRGTMDDKVGVIGIMESVEALLKDGYQPRRTIYLAFGHDEEVGGTMGMKVMVDHLKQAGVEPEFVLDEGAGISKGMVPGIDENVALIGIAEKGFLSLDLTITLVGGHSSMPEKETAIDVLSGAVARLKQQPFPPKISPPLAAFMEHLGPEMPFMQKLVLANKGVLEPLILRIYGSNGSTNAMIRTTTSPTIFNSGVKDNVIPQTARATVNFRILPGETIESVTDHVRETMNDERISITHRDFYSNPSSVTPLDSFGYTAVRQTASEIFPDALISPFLVVGATDSRYFNDLTDNVLRFTSSTITPATIKAFHGLNERIAVRDFENGIRFYQQLIKNSAE